MYVVGITGGIGSGKSAVSDRFAKRGIKVVDADLASRVIVEPGQPALKQIATQFGNEVLLPDGSLNRRNLRDIIFKNPDKRKWLEQLLHPLIGEYLQTELASANSVYVILVSPLLIKTGQINMCERVLVVDVPEYLQVQRVMQRDSNSADQVVAIIDVQSSREERLTHADDVIVNDQSLAELDTAVAELHARYLTLAETQSQPS